MSRRPDLALLATFYAAWKTFYSVQTGAEPWWTALFGLAAFGLGVLAVVGRWSRRQAASREAG